MSEPTKFSGKSETYPCESFEAQSYSHEQLTNDPEDDTRQVIDLYMYMLTKGVALVGKNNYFNVATYKKQDTAGEAPNTCTLRISRGRADPKNCHFLYAVSFGKDDYERLAYVMQEDGAIVRSQEPRRGEVEVPAAELLSQMQDFFGPATSQLLVTNFTSDKSKWLNFLRVEKGLKLDASQIDIDSSSYEGYRAKLFGWRFDEGKIAFGGIVRATDSQIGQNIVSSADVLQKSKERIKGITDQARSFLANNNLSDNMQAPIEGALIYKYSGLHPGSIMRLVEAEYPDNKDVIRIFYGYFANGKYLLE